MHVLSRSSHVILLHEFASLNNERDRIEGPIFIDFVGLTSLSNSETVWLIDFALFHTKKGSEREKEWKSTNCISDLIW